MQKYVTSHGNYSCRTIRWQEVDRPGALISRKEHESDDEVFIDTQHTQHTSDGVEKVRQHYNCQCQFQCLNIQRATSVFVCCIVTFMRTLLFVTTSETTNSNINSTFRLIPTTIFRSVCTIGNTHRFRRPQSSLRRVFLWLYNTASTILAVLLRQRVERRAKSLSFYSPCNWV